MFFTSESEAKPEQRLAALLVYFLMFNWFWSPIIDPTSLTSVIILFCNILQRTRTELLGSFV